MRVARTVHIMVPGQGTGLSGHMQRRARSDNLAHSRRVGKGGERQVAGTIADARRLGRHSDGARSNYGVAHYSLEVHAFPRVERAGLQCVCVWLQRRHS